MKVQKSRILQRLLFLFIVALCVLLFNCDPFKGEGDEYYYDTHYENFPIGDFEGEFVGIDVEITNGPADKIFAFKIVEGDENGNYPERGSNADSIIDTGSFILPAVYGEETNLFLGYRNYKVYAFVDNNGNFRDTNAPDASDDVFDPDNPANTSNGYIHIDPNINPNLISIEYNDFDVIL